MNAEEKIIDKQELFSEGNQETAGNESKTVFAATPLGAIEQKENLVTLFEEELGVSFHQISPGEKAKAIVTFEEEGSKQTYAVFISQGKDRSFPVKVFPLVPSGFELLGYSKRKLFKKASVYDVKPDKGQGGEVYLSTMRMRRISQRYKEAETWSRNDVKDYIQEISDWTKKTSPLRNELIEKKNAKREKRYLSCPMNRFSYIEGPNKRCKEIRISDRANTAMLAEALSRDPDETGGIMLGIIDKDIWYVVETTDPGISTFHNHIHHEMDTKYLNHIYPVISRLYEHDLCLVGLYHRHPGTFNKFSRDDDETNARYGEAIGNGTLSFLLNFVPEPKLTCYYFDDKGSGCYYTPDVKIGDKYFKGTDYLVLADEKTLMMRKDQMQREIKGVS